MQVDFDPGRISYEELLEVFWESHDPARRTWSSQYRSAVFFADERQRESAERSKKARERREDRKMRTEIAPLRGFTSAEDYHQKHGLRSAAGDDELALLFTDATGLRDSTLAARLNGYLAGHGTREEVLGSAEPLSLSREQKEALHRILERTGR